MIPYLKEAIGNLFKPSVTSKFPEKPVETPKNYRGRISFNADQCIGCGMCIRVCSPGAITKTQKPVEGGQEITMEFDLSSCTFCGMCSDFCPKKTITLTGDSQMVELDKNNFKVSGSFIKKAPPKPTPEHLKKIAEAKKAAAEKKALENKVTS